ncbi:MAG TPA: hypothetical protein VME69_02920 [Methylocella sp.]|nr:hypothetical protein [Methylocella sp.]
MSQSFHYVNFNPWVGEHYATGLWGRKLLIIGESHYTQWDGETHNLSHEITRECVLEILNGEGGAPYWSRVLNRVGGDEYRSRRSDFWNQVAFYNFIQSQLNGGAGTRPTLTQIKEAGSAFEEVVKYLKPERIIVTGRTVGRYFKKIPGYQQLTSLRTESEPLPVGYFNFTQKKNFITITGHPRSAYFPRSLSPVLKEFIERDFDSE